MVEKAMDRLASAGVFDDEVQLTRPFGEQLAQLPLKPLHAMLLIRSLDQGCFEQIISLIALWLTKGEYFDHEKSGPFITQEGDTLTWLNIYESFLKTGPARPMWCRKYGLSEQRLLQAANVRGQLLRILRHRHIKTHHSELATSATIRKCIASVYKWNYAFQLPDGSFKTRCGSMVCVSIELSSFEVVFTN
ncbi:hypothetical protein ABW20_dc0107500 [Dactylellina cionopaga]|nr:hypothetical protein ABW20_dc0107500 [Dactylellina cionopaga]